MAYSEYIGRSVEDAIESAKARLGISKEEMEIEILDPGSKGFLGIGNRLARIRVKPLHEEEEETLEDLVDSIYRKEEPAPIKPAPEAVPTLVRPAPVKAAAEKPAEKPVPAKPAPVMQPRQVILEKPLPTEETTQNEEAEEVEKIPEEPVGTPIDLANDKEASSAVAFLGSVAMLMGAEGLEYTPYQLEDGTMRIDVAGDTDGILIGHRGETLNALQLIVNLAAHQGSEEESETAHRRITIDVGGYRRRREETLSRLARRLAMKAIRTRRKVSLEPMNSYERRIIHSALSNMRDVTTQSQGEDPNRFVVIYPKQQNRRRY